MGSYDEKTLTIFGFVFFNAVIAILVGVVWVVPALRSLGNARSIIQMQESRYVAESRFLEEYEENMQALHILEQRPRLLRYDEFASALEGISQLAATHGLVRDEFFATAPVGNFVFMPEFEKLFQMNIRVTYNGYLYDALNFVYDLSTRCRILSMSVDMERVPRLSVEFALFGSE